MQKKILSAVAVALVAVALVLAGRFSVTGDTANPAPARGDMAAENTAGAGADGAGGNESTPPSSGAKTDEENSNTAESGNERQQDCTATDPPIPLHSISTARRDLPPDGPYLVQVQMFQLEASSSRLQHDLQMANEPFVVLCVTDTSGQVLTLVALGPIADKSLAQRKLENFKLIRPELKNSMDIHFAPPPK